MDDFMSMPIDVLNLSSRSYNCLRRSGISKLGELANLSEDDLFAMRNLGQKSAKEVMQKYAEFCALPNINGSKTVSETESDSSDLSEEQKSAVRNRLDMREIKIDVLEKLTPREYNLLLINDLTDLSDIAFSGKDELMTIQGMDEKSAEGIERCCREYMENDEEVCKIINEVTCDIKDIVGIDIMELRLFPEYKKYFIKYFSVNDSDIAELDLPSRAKNVLLKYRYKKFSDIVTMSESSLADLKGMTFDTAEKIIRLISDLLNRKKDRILAVCSGDISALWEDETLMERILLLYENTPFYGFNFDEIVSKLVLSDDYPEDHLKKIIGRMLAEKKLEYVDYRCYKVYPKFCDYIENTSDIDERKRDIIIKRLKGATLDAIAADYGLTRERIRQTISSIAREITKKLRKPVFDEDFYRYFFETYAVEKNDLEKWFGITPYMNIYFEITGSKSGTESINKALEDMTLNAGMRLKVKKYINRDKVYIDGMYIPKRRAELEEAVVRKFCTDNVSFTDFVGIYNKFLREMDISPEENVYYTDDVIRTRKNRLPETHFLLWKMNEQIRYYDVDGQDYTELLDALDLGSYKNTELSTMKFMELYPELMKKYDIRDQYELHNLLRKIISDGQYPELDFGRMPELKFGEFDRTAALFDLLIDYSPIRAEDFANIVHNEYGYDQLLVQTTYMQPLSQYYHDGVYSVEFNDIPQDKKSKLKLILTDDFYYISEIRKIYAELFPDADMEQINPRSLKSMGFVVLSRYAIQNYSSLEAYFESLFTGKDIVDITSYKKKFATIQSFWMKLYDLKCSLDVIEFEPDKIINFRRLSKSGITKDMLRSFCDKVYDFVKAETYFTIRSIRNDGFNDSLFELGFDDLFYANLFLSYEKVSNMKMMGTIVMYKGQKEVTFSSFETDIIRQHGSIDVIDLMNELNDRYGCKLKDTYDLTHKVKGTEVYFDDILRRFYANEDLYYSELDETEVF